MPFLNALALKWNINWGTVPIKWARLPPDCILLDNWVFEHFILVDEPFAKALRSLEMFAWANNNLCGKLVSSLEPPITFDEIFKVAPVSFLF